MKNKIRFFEKNGELFIGDVISPSYSSSSYDDDASFDDIVQEYNNICGTSTEVADFIKNICVVENPAKISFTTESSTKDATVTLVWDIKPMFWQEAFSTSASSLNKRQFYFNKSDISMSTISYENAPSELIQSYIDVCGGNI